MNKILVFPSSMREGLVFLEQTRPLGMQIVGASSLRNDPNAKEFDHWLHLPRIWDQDFPARLELALVEQNIDLIFCPNCVAHPVIKTLIEQGKISAKLLPHQFYIELARWQKLEQRADAALAIARQVSSAEVRITRQEIVSWLNYIDRIMGNSGEAKLAAMLGALACSPKGDVVEIGAYFGKSAAWLLMAARFFDIGNVLAIDSWLMKASVQKDAPQLVQDLARVDCWDAIATAFFANLQPIGFDCFNVIRRTSIEALPTYEKGIVHSDQFGTTSYSGEIALLHIDGNHDYSVVCNDVELWGKHLSNGGWLVLDDYCWPHGGGPKKAGDILLQNNSAKIKNSFVIDGALFIQFSESDKQTRGQSLSLGSL